MTACFNLPTTPAPTRGREKKKPLPLMGRGWGGVIKKCLSDSVRLVFALTLGAAALFAATPSQAVDIQRVVSPGGIEAWLVEQHTIPLIAMDFAFRGGTKLDPGDKAGLANMVSGLIAEGAGDLDSQAFQQRLEELAIRMNFQADHDAFHGSLQTLTENRDEAFRLLKLALTAPRYDAEPVARVRAQILTGLKQAEEDPEEIASNTWFKTAFPDHPYGSPVEGTPQTIVNITGPDLRGFAGRQFSRERLVVAVVGDIDAKTLAGLLDASFGALPIAARAKPGAVVTPKTAATVAIARDIPQTVMMFGMPGLLRNDPDFIPAYVMNYVLGGGGFNSRLMAEIREKRGLAYSVDTQLMPLEQAGLFIGSVATQNDRASETVALIRQELTRLRDTGVTQAELDNAKIYLVGSFPLRFDSNAKISGQLLGLQLEELGIDYFNIRNGLIMAVTLADVNRVARRLLTPDSLLLVSVGKPAAEQPPK